MPPLGLHMTVARELALEIGSKRIDADRGAYYLGATTPDIRVITRWDRERTHFFDLGNMEHQSGVRALFDQHAELGDAETLGTSTAAFLAGYISHLVLDEEYITQIYRNYFGAGGVLGDELMANVMDRLLQLHLDREERKDLCAVVDIRDALMQTAVDVAIDFIARDTLLEWREWSVRVISTAPTFEKMLARHLHDVGIRGEEAIAQYLKEHETELISDTIDRIGEDRIREYLSSAKAKAVRAIRDYVS